MPRIAIAACSYFIPQSVVIPRFALHISWNASAAMGRKLFRRRFSSTRLGIDCNELASLFTPPTSPPPNPARRLPSSCSVSSTRVADRPAAMSTASPASKFWLERLRSRSGAAVLPAGNPHTLRNDTCVATAATICSLPPSPPSPPSPPPTPPLLPSPENAEPSKFNCRSVLLPAMAAVIASAAPG